MGVALMLSLEDRQMLLKMRSETLRPERKVALAHAIGPSCATCDALDATTRHCQHWEQSIQPQHNPLEIQCEAYRSGILMMEEKA
jgi:hypothetical protein